MTSATTVRASRRTSTRRLDATGGGAITRSVLPGGVRLVTEAMPGVRSITVGVWVPVGSRDESPALAGTSHFLEHLLFKGTSSRTALDIAKAMDAVGGMRRFVKAGGTVVVKPNASFMDGPQAGTSTHPEVVASVVTMCRKAGAAKVIVMDHTLRGAAQTCLQSNGIGAAVKQAGGEILAFGAGESGHGVDAAIPGGVALHKTNIYPELLSADLVITVPKAKHHGSAGLSLGMKNFIGVITEMSSIHNVGLHQGIADLNTLIKPGLSIVDATTILLDNGPGGPGPTRSANTVIASHDVVAADAFACTLFGKSPSEIGYIVAGNRGGLG